LENHDFFKRPVLNKQSFSAMLDEHLRLFDIRGKLAAMTVRTRERAATDLALTFNPMGNLKPRHQASGEPS
jgi:hypothetical protein